MWVSPFPVLSAAGTPPGDAGVQGCGSLVDPHVRSGIIFFWMGFSENLQETHETLISDGGKPWFLFGDFSLKPSWWHDQQKLRAASHCFQCVSHFQLLVVVISSFVGHAIHESGVTGDLYKLGKHHFHERNHGKSWQTLEFRSPVRVVCGPRGAVPGTKGRAPRTARIVAFWNPMNWMSMQRSRATICYKR